MSATSKYCKRITSWLTLQSALEHFNTTSKCWVCCFSLVLQSTSRLHYSLKRPPLVQALFSHYEQWSVDELIGRDWPHKTPHATPWPDPTHWIRFQSFGFQLDVITYSDPDQHQGSHQMSYETIGWPLPALHQVGMNWDFQDPTWKTGELPGKTFHPHWSGLVANPVFFATVVWLILFAPSDHWRRLVRKERRKLSCCEECGYDLHAGLNNRCPECGSTKSGPSESVFETAATRPDPGESNAAEA